MKAIKDLLEKHEGRRAKAYEDSVGKWTVGIGRNLEDNPLSIDEQIFLCQHVELPDVVIEHLLENDIMKTIQDLRRFYWFGTLDPVRTGVMIDMCFNLGISRFSKFRKMISAIEKRNFNNASNEMLSSLWADQVGVRAAELAGMMKTGEP